MERDRGRNYEKGVRAGSGTARHRARWCFILFGLVSEFFDCAAQRSPHTAHRTITFPVVASAQA